MPDTEHYRKLERMYAGAPVNAWYRPQLTVATIRPLHRGFGKST